jgi:cyclopropane fatty-acyl-phospholipid synthase-like methyltransferase
MDWRRYWEDFPARFGEEEFCKQVGRTAHGGKPTPEAELQIAIDQVQQGLGLCADDRLLDLCCGNGLLTQRLASDVSHVTGIDFSQVMVETARRHHQRPNTCFERGSVLDLAAALPNLEQPFTKACLLESLHYFGPHEFEAILIGLSAVARGDAVFYFSGITDAAKQDLFYDTEERRRERARRLADGTDVMGHWWTRDELLDVAHRRGLECEFIPQDPRLNTAHYRFDLKLTATAPRLEDACTSASE